MNNQFLCTSCNKYFSSLPILSQFTANTHVCEDCGHKELEQIQMNKLPNNEEINEY